MKFDELDEQMRVFETSSDQCVLPGIHMVARLDGRGFTRLTKEVCDFEAPFDERFRDMMVQTTKSLMDCGFRVVYAFTQSDEISLLFDLNERVFGRKIRKYISTLAGEASAQFSLLLGKAASFDCRVSQLPTAEQVVDYFRWRSEDACRNALTGWCYWTLRKAGLSYKQATQKLLGLCVGEKNELLWQHGINFNDLPAWQKRGVGLYWEEFERPSVNRLTDQAVVSLRRRVRTDFGLPMKEDYSKFVQAFVTPLEASG